GPHADAPRRRPYPARGLSAVRAPRSPATSAAASAWMPLPFGSVSTTSARAFTASIALATATDTPATAKSGMSFSPSPTATVALGGSPMARSAASMPVRLLMPCGMTIAEARLRTTRRSTPNLAIAAESFASWLQDVERDHAGALQLGDEAVRHPWGQELLLTRRCVEDGCAVLEHDRLEETAGIEDVLQLLAGAPGHQNEMDA